MPVRKDKRARKFYGTRTWGGGNTKKRRGKGSRGGKGYAGSHKQRWTYIVKYEPEHFGKHGFTSIRKKLESKSLRKISQEINQGIYKKEKEYYLVNIPKYRVTGSGDIKYKIQLNAVYCTPKAKNKVEKAGGKIS